MAWERRGTIQVTNGSVNVVGTGTYFTSVTVGSGIAIDGYIYAVETITDNTHITLSRAYVGTSGSGKSYEIFPTQSYASDVYAEVVDLLNTFGPFRGSVDDLNALILSKVDDAAASAAAAASSAASALADKNTTATLKSDVITLKSDVTALKSDVTALKDTATTQAGIATTKASEAAASAASALSDKNTTATLKGDVITLKSDVTTLKSDVTTLKDTATTQAGIATTKASEAASSAAAALADKNTTATLKGDVITLKSDVTTLKDTATTQAGIATTKAGEAASSASAAATSATNAANSKTGADSARDAALAAKADAEAALASTLTALDNFDDRYLGAKATPPTVDNDGNALLGGALYYKTGAGAGMYVWDGSAWQAAYVDGANYVAKFGDTMTGSLTLAGDPSSALHAATKQYVDNKTITLTGDATGSGTSSFAVTLANSGVSAGTYKSVTVDAKGRVTAGTNPTTLSGYGITDALSINGGNLSNSLGIVNASQPTLFLNTTHATNKRSTVDFRANGATQFQIGVDAGINGTRDFYVFDGVANSQRLIINSSGAAWFGGSISATNLSGTNTGDQTITLTGDVTGSGTGSFAATLANTGVSAGTYTKVTVDAKGRVTSGTGLNFTDVSGGLGYTPLQQGGGSGQGNNKLYVGWLGSNLGLQVDSTNYGASWPINIQGSAASITGTYSGTISSSQVTSALGFTPTRYDSNSQAGKITIYNSVASNDVFNGGLELREVGGVGSSQSHYSYSPGLTFHWSSVAAAQLYMNASGEFVFGAQTDKNNVRGIRAGTVYSNGSPCVTTASGTAPAATLATKSSTLAQNGSNGAAMTFNWSGQGGQPSWLWGGNNGADMYVYNPSNFNVNSATEARLLRPNTITGGNVSDIVYQTIADNDFFRIRTGGNATNDGYVEIATADDGNEPIYVRQYTGVFSSIARTAALLDSNGNTVFPGNCYSNTFHTNGTVTGVNGVYSSNWFRVNGSGTGLYNETNSRGVSTPDGQTSYGNILCYGAGLNGWSGIALSSANKCNWMTDGNAWGMYNTTATGWMMSSDMSGNVTFAGNVTAYSDLRLKDNVREIDNIELRRDTLANAAIKYERDGRTRIGYGAQTLRDNGCAEFVREADDARKLATGTGTLSVDYGETAAVLAVASKRTDDRVAALEAQVAALMQTVTLLQNQLKGE